MDDYDDYASGYEWVVNHAFGHPTYFDGKGVVRYCDNHKPTTWPSERPCPRCGKLPTPEGHDPCIANLPGVAAACCGHGFNGYIMFEEGRTIRYPRATVDDEVRSSRP
jgi:hypothetical protein